MYDTISPTQVNQFLEEGPSCWTFWTFLIASAAAIRSFARANRSFDMNQNINSKVSKAPTQNPFYIGILHFRLPNFCFFAFLRVCLTASVSVPVALTLVYMCLCCAPICRSFSPELPDNLVGFLLIERSFFVAFPFHYVAQKEPRSETNTDTATNADADT